VRALRGGAESAALNIGTGRGWSVRDLIDCARQVTNRDIPLQVGPRRPGDPPVLIADPTGARHRLDRQPRYADLATQVTRAWAWRRGGVKSRKRMQRSVAKIASR
jgi:UDP-glucose 4-epimerase